MSVINQKYTIAYPAEANGQGQVKGDAAETNEPSPEKANTNVSLVLQWFWLLAPTEEAGQAGQRLRSGWRLK